MSPSNCTNCWSGCSTSPIVDEQDRLVAVARERQPNERLRIGNFTIGDSEPAFIIAEIGINHNGSLDLAKRLTDAAAAAGADCAKFQMRDLSALYSNAGEASDPKENLGSQYTLDLLTRFQLSVDEMLAAFDYCKEQGIFAAVYALGSRKPGGAGRLRHGGLQSRLGGFDQPRPAARISCYWQAADLLHGHVHGERNPRIDGAAQASRRTVCAAALQLYLSSTV